MQEQIKKSQGNGNKELWKFAHQYVKFVQNVVSSAVKVLFVLFVRILVISRGRDNPREYLAGTV